MLDYKLLDALAHVVREGGFDKAARTLNITQSAVSQRIRQLEDLTGMVLLTRATPPSPTPGGTALLKHHIQVSHLETDLSDTLNPKGSGDFRTLALGINADSLATWFYPALDSFLKENCVLLDLRVADQDDTRSLLRDGRVLGCISAEARPVQGCRTISIGTMSYRLLATPEFRDRFFIGGLTWENISCAPAVIFNRKDDLHTRFLARKFGPDPESPRQIPAHYIPSSEKFVTLIVSGAAYGLVPDLQSDYYIKRGQLVDLCPGEVEEVPLYWHRWAIQSPLLDRLSKAIVKNSAIW